MSARRPVRPYWQRTRMVLQCTFGRHGVAAGDWLRFNPAARSTLCADCAERHYQMRPPAGAVALPETPAEARARQLGERD